MIIVIDGPSGSGKSSTAKAVAERLDLQYLDSGALYRAVTWVWLKEGRPETSFIDILTSKEIHFEYRQGRFTVLIDGVNIDREIRTQQVSDHVSDLSARPEIRTFVNGLMRRRVSEGTFIADGRDLGSAVFPDAELKFYMDADLDTRADRRYRELIDSGQPANYKQVRRNLQSRDQKDRTRKTDPLLELDDAIRVDTSGIEFDVQVDIICRRIKEYFSDTFKQKQ
jgi:CMP/dCMP kinase